MIRRKRVHNRLRKLLHTLASFSFVIWLVGFFGFHIGGWMFAFLAFSLVTALWLLLAKNHAAGP